MKARNWFKGALLYSSYSTDILKQEPHWRVPSELSTGAVGMGLAIASLRPSNGVFQLILRARKGQCLQCW